jgi:hypothetical protein
MYCVLKSAIYLNVMAVQLVLLNVNSLQSSNDDTGNGSSGVDESTLASSTVGLNRASTRGRSGSSRLASTRGLGGLLSRGGDDGNDTLGLGGSSSSLGRLAHNVTRADRKGSSILGQLGALLDGGGDLVLVLAVPGDDLGAVAGVVLGQRRGDGEVARVGLGVLHEVGDDSGRRSREGLVDVKDGALALSAEAVDETGSISRTGGIGGTRGQEVALHERMGHEAVGRDGRGEKRGEDDGLHFE